MVQYYKFYPYWVKSKQLKDKQTDVSQIIVSLNVVAV